jgi:hypothetical protein
MTPFFRGTIAGAAALAAMRLFLPIYHWTDNGLRLDLPSTVLHVLGIALLSVTVVLLVPALANTGRLRFGRKEIAVAGLFLWAAVALALLASAYIVVSSRYAYMRGPAMVRLDRWTGTPQRWSCHDEYNPVRAKAIIRGPDEPYESFRNRLRAAGALGEGGCGWRRF